MVGKRVLPIIVLIIIGKWKDLKKLGRCWGYYNKSKHLNKDEHELLLYIVTNVANVSFQRDDPK